MARRYIIPLPPVGHMNGKLAPSSQVVHNQPDTTHTEDGFYYGYRYAARPDVSRFALRDKARNLSVHPYTLDEERTQQAMTDAVAYAQSVLADPQRRAAAASAFRTQHRYIRLYNYIIATAITMGTPW